LTILNTYAFQDGQQD
jgi:hypothetical protein